MQLEFHALLVILKLENNIKVYFTSIVRNTKMKYTRVEKLKFACAE